MRRNWIDYSLKTTPMKTRQPTRRQLAYRGRGYMPPTRKRRAPRKPLGPVANVRQKAFIRRQFKRGFNATQITRVLRHPAMLKRTGGKKLRNRRVVATIKRMRVRDRETRKTYRRELKAKYGYQPTAKNRLLGLLARITNDQRFLIKLEREGYSLG